MSCDVCCNTFNKTNHKKVSCSFCDLGACRTCCQTYLLSTVEDAHCMGCKARWDRQFVDTWCTVKFRNTDLRRHREFVLFEREKALFPETQPDVERILKMRDLRVTIQRLRAEMIQLYHRYRVPIPVRDDSHFQRHPDLLAFHEMYTNHLLEYEELRTGHDVRDDDRRFVRKCPTEECKGFLDDTWYCGICRHTFCEACNELIVGEEHTCDPDAVQTMELLKKDTKPCPKCGEMIQKLSGCSQMWCPSCHTAFDWRNGVIELGRIHNPHYIEFQRRQNNNTMNREHGDIPCGGLPSYRELREYNPQCYEVLQLRMTLVRIEGELNWRWREMTDTRYLRIRYMLNEISEADFRCELQRMDKQNTKAQEVTHIFRMFFDTCSDELRQYMLGKSFEDVRAIIEPLIQYTNEIIKSIHKRYVCVTPYFIEKI